MGQAARATRKKRPQQGEWTSPLASRNSTTPAAGIASRRDARELEAFGAVSGLLIGTIGDVRITRKLTRIWISDIQVQYL
jgi:hypothetical protein